MVDHHFPKLHVKLILSTASSVDIHQRMVTTSTERTRQLTISNLPMFLYYGRQSHEIEYQALLFCVCNIAELGGAWGQGFGFHTLVHSYVCVT